MHNTQLSSLLEYQLSCVCSADSLHAHSVRTWGTKMQCSLDTHCCQLVLLNPTWWPPPSVQGPTCARVTGRAGQHPSGRACWRCDKYAQ